MARVAARPPSKVRSIYYCFMIRSEEKLCALCIISCVQKRHEGLRWFQIWSKFRGKRCKKINKLRTCIFFKGLLGAPGEECECAAGKFILAFAANPDWWPTSIKCDNFVSYPILQRFYFYSIKILYAVIKKNPKLFFPLLLSVLPPREFIPISCDKRIKPRGASEASHSCSNQINYFRQQHTRKKEENTTVRKRTIRAPLSELTNKK